MDRRGSVPLGITFFLFSTASIPALGPIQPPGQCVDLGPFPVVMEPVCEADHSPLFSAEVKNDGAIPPFPICLHGIVLN
jgi:hypothetical protein